MMTPLQHKWSAGRSGRSAHGDLDRRTADTSLRSQAPWDGNLERPVGSDGAVRETRRTRVPTYRTLCVRLCDGYYFPISFAVTRDRFARDARICESRCGGQARLYVYRNPGGELDDMKDLKGQPYRALHTAFLYRTAYVPSCKCQADPWEADAMDRHRAYALAVAARKGIKDAAQELHALQVKLASRVAANSKTAAVGLKESALGQVEPKPNVVAADGVRVMRLGSAVKPKVGPKHRGRNRPTSVSDADWRNRVFYGTN